MDYFLEEAGKIKAILVDWIDDTFKSTFEAFSDAGRVGIQQIYIDGVKRENSTFADHIAAPGAYFPKEVVQSMCLCAAWVSAALLNCEKEDQSAWGPLVKSAQEFGFCHGAAFLSIHDDTRQRAERSVNGTKGASTLHGPRNELKTWALSQAKEIQGSHKNISRKLAANIPKHLEDVSKDPERLIYDTLRAPAKPN